MDFAQASCTEFVTVLASNAPVPGGGGASALVGAIGTALGNMVGSLTVGKKKYADVEEEIIALKAKCDALQKLLLEGVAFRLEGDDLFLHIGILLLAYGKGAYHVAQSRADGAHQGGGPAAAGNRGVGS